MTVSIAVTGGTSGTNYNIPPTSITIPANQLTKYFFLIFLSLIVFLISTATIRPKLDNICGENLLVTVTISNPTGGNRGVVSLTAPSSVTFNIVNSDVCEVRFSSSSVTFAEDTGMYMSSASEFQVY